MHRLITPSRLTVLLGFTLATAMPAASALAQRKSEPLPAPQAAEPQPPAPDLKQKPPGKDQPAPDGKSAGGDTTPQRDPAKPRFKAPQTADEKAKVLGDLYAHLATAEDEEAAKRVAGQIERLWLFSGSATVDLLMERARKAIGESKHDLAQQLLNAVVSIAPDYAEGFNRRAFLKFTRNDREGAVGDLRRVLALEPNHFKALEGLAQIWRDTGNKKGAYRVIKQLLEVNPFAPNAKQLHDELQRDVDGQGI